MGRDYFAESLGRKSAPAKTEDFIASYWKERARRRKKGEESRYLHPVDWAIGHVFVSNNFLKTHKRKFIKRDTWGTKKMKNDTEMGKWSEEEMRLTDGEEPLYSCTPRERFKWREEKPVTFLWVDGKRKLRCHILEQSYKYSKNDSYLREVQRAFSLHDFTNRFERNNDSKVLERQAWILKHGLFSILQVEVQFTINE